MRLFAQRDGDERSEASATNSPDLETAVGVWGKKRRLTDLGRAVILDSYLTLGGTPPP